MSTLVFLEKYNNYFNRIIKTENSLEAYLTGRNTKTFGNLNFNPNDSVSTNLVINWAEEWFPDYMLVLNGSNNLVSRWFVVEAERTREGQYSIQLKRDTVADYKNLILNAPTYVEKATLSSDDPLIYNSEGMSYNQIKKQEILLKDETQMPWIVGYCVQDSNRHPNSGYYEGSSKIRTLITSNQIPTWIKNAFGTTKKFAVYDDLYAPLYNKMQWRSRDSAFGIHGYELAEIDNIYDDSSSYSYDTSINWYDGWDMSVYVNFSMNMWDALFDRDKLNHHIS